MSMTSSRPYMIRALYEWIVENSCTPHILVDAHVEGVSVPQQHVNKDGQIILNIAPSALKDLFIGLDAISFSARFGGMPFNLYIPCGAILGVYARENGQGMSFEVETNTRPPSPDPTPIGGGAKSPKKPGLRVVK